MIFAWTRWPRSSNGELKRESLNWSNWRELDYSPRRKSSKIFFFRFINLSTVPSLTAHQRVIIINTRINSVIHADMDAGCCF